MVYVVTQRRYRSKKCFLWRKCKNSYQRHLARCRKKHLKCNQEYEINPKQFLAKRSKGCTYCRIKERTKTHETFLKEVYSLVKDEYTVLSKYISSNQKIKRLLINGKKK